MKKNVGKNLTNYQIYNLQGNYMWLYQFYLTLRNDCLQSRIQKLILHNKFLFQKQLPQQIQSQENKQTMKVFALISGGKDSIFNIHKCIEQGHQIVALGNLYNQYEGQQGKQLDSYMYQTVGTNITLAIAQCLQKPIYRRKITGKPKIINLEYKEQHEAQKQGDEVEDLFELVKEVKSKHPQIDAVSTGAIFSTYQKLRVENICARIGMTSLAYLWEREQTQLLQEMIEYPLNAIIIKVASYGLQFKHLGKTLTQLKPMFMKLKDECGMNVCGQGGEYESLVLDCPLFVKKIVLQLICLTQREQTEIVEVDKCQIAPVGYLLIKKYRLEDK